MPRYIDAYKMMDGYGTTFPYNLEYCSDDDLIEWLESQPTEDVVPRSEVEKAKQEVVREIFEEIESLVAKYIDISIKTKSITSELNFEDMETDLAELKKKYIGE